MASLTITQSYSARFTVPPDTLIRAWNCILMQRGGESNFRGFSAQISHRQIFE